MPNLSPKDDRMAAHIKESEMKRGVDPKKATSIGFATAEKFKSAKKDKPWWKRGQK